MNLEEWEKQSEKPFRDMLAAGRWVEAILYCRDSSEKTSWSGWHLERLFEAAKAAMKEAAQ